MTSMLPSELEEHLLPDEARARLPLYRSIASELQDRVKELQTLAAAAKLPQPTETRRLRDRVQECVAELEGLGAEVDGFRPVSLLVPVRSGEGGEQYLSWRLGASDFELADHRL